MRSVEDKIDPKSEYYINSPAASVSETFLYPTHLGHFFYCPGYRQHRLRFDSFLIMYVMDGAFTLEYNGKKLYADKNSFVLMDCYQEHCYYTDAGGETIWIHFDGPPARTMYEMILDRHGNVFTLENPLPLIGCMAKICHPYTHREPIREILISKYLNDLLTELVIYTPLQAKTLQRVSAVENVRLYIQEHIQDELRVEDLAKQALMSPYYFIRVFKKETGMSPHEYVLNYRLGIAKILLLETNLSVNAICFESGFSSESVFCSAFKKKTGVTPTAYRNERTRQAPVS